MSNLGGGAQIRVWVAGVGRMIGLACNVCSSSGEV